MCKQNCPFVLRKFLEPEDQTARQEGYAYETHTFLPNRYYQSIQEKKKKKKKPLLSVSEVFATESFHIVELCVVTPCIVIDE